MTKLEQVEKSIRSMNTVELEALAGIETNFDARELPQEAYRYFPNLTEDMLKIPPSKRECPALMEFTAMQTLAEIVLRERGRNPVDTPAYKTPRLGRVAHGA